MRPIVLALALCTLATPALAQLTLQGVWKGTLTTSIHTDRGYPFELYLYRDGARVWGRSYITVKPDSTIVMDLEGTMHQDLSISLYEKKFSGDKVRGPLAPFFRRYQLSFKRGLFEASLNGFWQEVRDDAFNNRRKRGRIYLRKETSDKA
jgi:hypothetical protein